MAGPDEQAIYSIGAVARMLDIPPSTIRAWEVRYGLISPARSEGSQRLYSPAQLEQLRFIKAQIEAGASAADAHRLLAQGDEGARPATPLDPGTGHRPLVLIAERDPYAADLAAHFLRNDGCDVVVALDVAQARLQFHERTPDVVLIDLLISAAEGFRLASDFAAAGASKVLAVSALDSAVEANDSGAAAFLRKPLRPSRLVSTVRDLLTPSAPARQRKQAVRT
ncbi:MAG TPA: MerR family transcriptional regulator [Candidatus Dormibacteraeota bacterium]|nr:MerR family transcriptional regulator [Candidatus Dormibacteraeota bacterium]